MLWMPLALAVALVPSPDLLSDGIGNSIEVPQDNSVLYIPVDDWHEFDTPAPASSAEAPLASSEEYAYARVPSVKTATEVQAASSVVQAVHAIKKASASKKELHLETAKAFEANDEVYIAAVSAAIMHEVDTATAAEVVSAAVAAASEAKAVAVLKAVAASTDKAKAQVVLGEALMAATSSSIDAVLKAAAVDTAFGIALVRAASASVACREAAAYRAVLAKAFAAADAPTRRVFINAAFDALPIDSEMHAAHAAHAVAEAAVESQIDAADIACAIMAQPTARAQKIAVAMLESMPKQQAQECIAAVAADDDFAKADIVIAAAYAAALRNSAAVSSEQSRATMFRLLARRIPPGRLVKQPSSEWYDHFTAQGGSKLWWIISEARRRAAAGQPIDDLRAAFDQAMAEWIMLDEDLHIPDEE